MNTNTQKQTTHQVIDRNTGLVVFEGNYTECKSYFTNEGYGLSIKRSDEPLFDEEGNYDVIESN